jgi:uncharacterized OB-fold protein
MTLPVERVTESAGAAPYWDAARRGQLVLPFCTHCAGAIWYPRAFCPRCGSWAVEWREASGRGTVYSHTTIRRGFGTYSDAGPYVVAYVELLEGPRLLTNIAECDPDQVTIGKEVTAVFEFGTDGEVLLRFRLITAAEDLTS